ncbi:MAG: bifunctional diaminohydroxyphosphoribosylaminopyrimidine deaminase/5-amino-6-(5-phosphoribosylamino)uracil reductase RibD [Synergistales bacterium]|nr:bifunctional diaminohydroxyphosphoribosylaminopyrimidine deaminase/5-amino-6-(5-phosphoribosylamino)uracil reductase RibD [Synergistales bacterium]
MIIQKRERAMNNRSLDEYYMHMALSLAMRGCGKVSPNPMVGCVLVSDQQILSKGYHRFHGGPHAEIEAINSSPVPVNGATLYVNLEPCSHQGKTPPCAPRIVAEGIKRVVVGMTDPNPLVSGRGLDIMKSGGIRVTEGILEEQCKWQNRGFIRRVTISRPWVTLKAAIGIDGCLALRGGESKWITSLPSRCKAHLLRSQHDALLVGMGTVRYDDPLLNVRFTEGPSPLKVLLTSGKDLTWGSRLFMQGQTLIFMPLGDLGSPRHPIITEGTEIIEMPMKKEHSALLDISEVLTILAERGINSLMVEGGSTIASQLLVNNLVDEVSIFIAPKLMGRGIRFTENMSFHLMKDTITLRSVRINRIANDLWLEGRPACSPDL